MNIQAIPSLRESNLIFKAFSFSLGLGSDGGDHFQYHYRLRARKLEEMTNLIGQGMGQYGPQAISLWASCWALPLGVINYLQASLSPP